MMTPYTYSQIPDWPRLRERYAAFWRGEVTDGSLIAQIQNPAPVPPKPEPWMEHADERVFLNPEKLFEFKAWQRRRWEWHNDLFQYCTPHYGPNVFAGFAGGQPLFKDGIVWHEPLIAHLNEADRIRFDPANRYWKIHLETAEYFSNACRGRIQLGNTEFGGTTDWLSALMGTENFLLAAIEEPARMRELALRLARECMDASRIVTPIIASHNDGSANWMPFWHPGNLGSLGDDMAAVLSPRIYADVFLPALRVMAAGTDVTVLHLHDCCAQHLGAFLDVEEIDAIQYGHDPNTGPFRNHLGAAQRIQAAGKKLFLTCVDTADVEFFISRLDPRGLAMLINCRNAEESRVMQERVREWTVQRLKALP